VNLADVLNQFGSDASEPRKTWLACVEHEGFLHAFLSARSFPVSVVSVTEVLAGDGEVEA
jgi:hypothetical protein